MRVRLRFSGFRAVLFLATLAFPSFRLQAEDAAPLGIIGALEEEISLLKSRMERVESREILGHAFFTGKLAGHPVVLARSGVGKVNAAMLTTLLVDRFRPSAVVFTGIAGAINPDLAPGDIVIGGQTGPHDFGKITPQGLVIQPAFVPADPSLLAAAQEVAGRVALDPLQVAGGSRPPRIMTGVIVTGDVFIASSAKKEELRGLLKADAVEMEGSAVAHVCARAGTPCLVIRSISDGANDAAPKDIQVFRKTAAANSAKLTLALLARLQKPIPESPERPQ